MASASLFTMVASSALRLPIHPHPVPVMHDVIIISRTKITGAMTKRPNAIISTQAKATIGKVNYFYFH